jgi:hemoglobin
MDAATTSTLFDRIGGAAGIAGLVARFSERVLADPLLAPTFAGADIDHLRHMQQEFFTVATGGPVGASSWSLRAAHAGRGITPAQLSAFTAHLVATLAELGVAGDDLDAVVHRVAMAADDVLGGATLGDGG